MKNLFTLCIICILAALIGSACSSSTYITKRRYTKGYFVDRHHAKRHVPANGNTETTQKTALVLPQVSEKIKDPNGAGTTLNKPAEKTIVASGTMERVTHTKSVKTKPGVRNLFKNPEAGMPAFFPVQKNFKQLKSGKVTGLSADSDDALSLLWIVIVIILILWLVGLLAGGWGLGGLINLLLVVALILLILWLLKIL